MSKRLEEITTSKETSSSHSLGIALKILQITQSNKGNFSVYKSCLLDEDSMSEICKAPSGLHQVGNETSCLFVFWTMHIQRQMGRDWSHVFHTISQTNPQIWDKNPSFPPGVKVLIMLEDMPMTPVFVSGMENNLK